MKPIFFVTLFLLAMQFTCMSQTTPGEKVFTEVNPPNFLVHNQLSPEILKLEYAGTLVNGTFKNTIGQEVNRFSRNTLTVSGYPLTLVNKRQQQLFVGFGYIRDQYTSVETQTLRPVFQTAFQSIYLDVFFNTRIQNKFYWFLYIQGGVNGDYPFLNLSNSSNGIVLNKINYKANRNMNVGLGIAYLTNLGKPMILPSVAFVYSQPHYLINIDLPVKVEMEGIFAHGKWRPVAGLSLQASAYYSNDLAQYFSSQGLVGYTGMRYRVFDLLYLYAGFQTTFNDVFQTASGTERIEIGNFTGQSRFTVSINVQVARFIPYMREE